MKKITLLFCLLICSISMYSQEMAAEDGFEPEHDQQIGINTTALVSQLINFSSSFSFFNNDYIFTYKNIKANGRSTFRFGFGGSVFYEKEDSDKRFNTNIKMRLGRERFTDISKRWRVYYGGDFKLGFEYTNAFFLDEPIRTYTAGGGPLCGLQFNINSRLSISTEASYDFLFFYNTNDGSKTRGFSTGFNIPDLFYLNYDF